MLRVAFVAMSGRAVLTCVVVDGIGEVAEWLARGKGQNVVVIGS